MCLPALPLDLGRLVLDPPLRPAGMSRTLGAPKIYIRTGDGVLRDASDFKARLIEDEAGAYGIDDNPPRRSPPAEALAPSGYPPQYVSAHERAKLEEQRRHIALIHEQNGLARAMLTARAQPGQVEGDAEGDTQTAAPPTRSRRHLDVHRQARVAPYAGDRQNQTVRNVRRRTQRTEQAPEGRREAALPRDVQDFEFGSTPGRAYLT